MTSSGFLTLIEKPTFSHQMSKFSTCSSSNSPSNLFFEKYLSSSSLAATQISSCRLSGMFVHIPYLRNFKLDR